MIHRFGSVMVLCATMALLGAQPAAAQKYPPCPAAPSPEAGTAPADTKTAVSAVSKLLENVGVAVNYEYQKTRDIILSANPRADQTVVVLTMANGFCEKIQSDAKLSGDQKTESLRAMWQDLFRRASGPTPIARTDKPTPPKNSQLGGQAGRLVLASATLTVAQDELDFTLPKPQTGYLRDAPFYITDANKYFVMVGSAASEDEGIRLMKRLKSKAPQYDFVLYSPYGSNIYYAVMMASWVPRDVANQALGLAKRDVAHDAITWACRGSGDSC